MRPVLRPKRERGRRQVGESHTGIQTSRAPEFLRKFPDADSFQMALETLALVQGLTQGHSERAVKIKHWALVRSSQSSQPQHGDPPSVEAHLSGTNQAVATVETEY